MEQVCFDVTTTVLTIATFAISVASGIANFVKKDSFLGKIINYIALNIKTGK